MRFFVVVKFFAFVFLAIWCNLLVHELKVYYIIQSNNKVSVKIIGMPKCCDCGRRDAQFSYNNFTFFQKVQPDFCEKYTFGDYQVFYHIDEYPEVFVTQYYAEHTLQSNIIAWILLLLFSGYVVIYIFRVDDGKPI